MVELKERLLDGEVIRTKTAGTSEKYSRMELGAFATTDQ